MPALLDLTGRRFARLVVISRQTNTTAVKPVWLCRCDCGALTDVMGYSLTSGHTQSCGCWQRQRTAEVSRVSSRTHGHSKTHPLYKLWAGLRSRCRNPNATGYERYGGRGIRICAKWDDFAAFVADVGPRPSPQHTLDRIDNDGHYEPGNVRWSTPSEQCNNSRNAMWVMYRGARMRLLDAWRASGERVPRDVITQRLRSGWSLPRALETPVRAR
jgi:hypothetical protein